MTKPAGQPHDTPRSTPRAPAPRTPAPPDDLTPAERRLWDAFRRGELCDLRPPDKDGDEASDDASDGDDAFGPERTVRAELIARLLLDGPPRELGRVSALKLAGARITGLLNLSGGRVLPFMELRECQFEGELLVPEAHFATIRLVRCRIPRIEAARLTTEGDLHLPQCAIPGGIRLTDARIGTDLLINQLTVGPDRYGRAISADGLTVRQDIEAEVMDVTGEISLRSARIGGRISLRGSELLNPYGRYALNAPRITVEHTLYLSAGWTNRYFGGGTPPTGVRTRPFTAEGGVRLDEGRFGNAVIADRARFRLTGGQQLSLRRIDTPELRLTLDEPPSGMVCLAGARVGHLRDAQTSWPGPGNIDLAGFSYASLSSQGPFPLSRRIAWLADATPEYNPEPYEHLAQALRDNGEDSEAREVLLARQRRRRETLPLAGKIWGYAQDITVGYGYRPGRAALWMAVLWAAGSLYFASHPTPKPVDGQAWPNWNPALFALDLLLPVVDLGQSHAWHLTGPAQWAAAAMTMVGWTLATTVATGVSRLLRRT